MADRGAHGEHILLPIDMPIPNVARESFISGVFKRTHMFNDVFGGLISGPARAASPTGSTGLSGLALGNGPIGRRNDVGEPGPSQLLNARHRMLTLVPVLPGSRIISARVRYWPDTAEDRPAFLIKRNLELGVQEDILTVAPAGGDEAFVTISVPVVVAAIGVLECYRMSRSVRQDAYTFWDKLGLL